MNIPSFPLTTPVMTEKGDFTPEYRQFFENLVQVLQQIMSSEGLFAALQTTDNINDMNNSEHRGAFWYDEDTHTYKVNENGVIKTITTA